MEALVKPIGKYTRMHAMPRHSISITQSLPMSKFTRFTHYMYRMKTTSNKLITNIL